MKIFLANYEPHRLGGGWTFANNLVKVMGDNIGSYDESDIFLICGPTMVQRDEVQIAKERGKKIVLRLDNVVRNSRNRNTGMSRMKEFSQLADLVIYQSQWAKDYLLPFTKVDGPVILNGVDLDLFKPVTKVSGTYIYSRFNRDETKNWEVARYWYSRRADPQSKLFIVGNFSPELVEGNFDFYNGESFQFIPTLEHNSYASLLNTMESFIYTYFNDACSNSLLEARASGCRIIDPHYFLETGGAQEIMELEDISLERMAKEYEEALSCL